MTGQVDPIDGHRETPLQTRDSVLRFGVEVYNSKLRGPIK